MSNETKISIIDDSPTEIPTEPASGSKDAAEKKKPSPSSQQQNGSAPQPTAKRKRRKKGTKPKFDTYAKVQRRIRKLGYKPEIAERKTKSRRKRAPNPKKKPMPKNEEELPEAAEAEARSDSDDDRVVEVKVDSAYVYLKRSDRMVVVQKKPYSYRKVNGKSTRYQNETQDEQERRLAKYRTYRENQRKRESETQEERQQSKERRRQLHHLKCEERKAAARAARQSEEMGKEVPYVPNAQKLENLRKEHQAFQLYMNRKCQEAKDEERCRKATEEGRIAAMETKIRHLDAQLHVQVLPSYSQLAMANGKPLVLMGNSSIGSCYYGTHSYSHKENMLGIVYSSDPVDQEIALLETSDSKLVPVQVINQTCEDFDDLLEIENIA